MNSTSLASNQLEQLKNAVREAADAAQNISEEEYVEFLDWMGGEADIRKMSHDEEGEDDET